MATKKGKPGGYLIRGADGWLYFINETKLKQFALKPEDQKTVAKARRKAKTLMELGLATSDSVPFLK
jgi:hypothetical protein